VSGRTLGAVGSPLRLNGGHAVKMTVDPCPSCGSRRWHHEGGGRFSCSRPGCGNEWECVHFWSIEKQNGARSSGRCRKCGERGEFGNVFPPFREKVKHKTCKGCLQTLFLDTDHYRRLPSLMYVSECLGCERDKAVETERTRRLAVEARHAADFVAEMV